MILFSMKIYPSLLWGVSVLLSVGATITPITDTNNISSTVKADQAAKLSATVHVSHTETEKNSASTHEPAEVTATPHIPVAPTEVITNTQVQLLQTTASDQSAHSGSMTEMVQSTEDQLHQQSPTISTEITPPEKTSITLPTTTAMETMSLTTGTTSSTITTASPTSAGSAKATSLSQGRSTNTFEFFSTVSPDSSPEAPSLIHKLSSPAVKDISSAMVNATTGSSPMLNHTSFFPERTTEMPTATTSNTIPPPKHKPISATTPYIATLAFSDRTKLQSTAESSSTNASTSTTTASNHSGGILIPVSPGKLPGPTSKSVTPVTKITENPPTTEVQSCSVRGIVKQCLIAVAALAALATIFMVSTIILCTKLSMRKYRVKKPQQATEMMCISALLPERNHNYTRQRNPVSNGVLVIPSGADSDDDGGDNLTLSSFLPENDRFV